MASNTADVNIGKLTQCAGNKRERVAAATAKTSELKVGVQKMYIKICRCVYVAIYN